MLTIKTQKRENDHNFHDVFEKFKSVVTEPEQYLTAQPAKCDTILNLLQDVYKIAAESETSKTQSPLILPQLITEEMDEEQVWQQLEMRNDVVIPKLLEETSTLLALRETKFEVRLKEDENDTEEEQSEEGDVDDLQNGEENSFDDSDHGTDDNEDDDDEDDDEDELEKRKPKKKGRTSIVDDKFFKLSEMEEFLEAEDEKDLRKKKGKPKMGDDDGIDYFAEDFGEDPGSDEEDNDEDEDAVYNINYNDFFDSQETGKKKGSDKKQKGKDHFASDAESEEPSKDKEEDDEESEQDDAVESDDEEDRDNKFDKNPFGEMEPASGSDSEPEDANVGGSKVEENRKEEEEIEEEKPKSSFELRQERLAERIREYEEVVLGEKPWQMKGEILATNRPHNSLLEEILEFDAAVRPAPLITEKTTKCLEDIIKQRIKDQAWDDVVRKVRPVQTPQEYRKHLVLDQEKSKESLAQIYEKEYQREMDKLKPQNLDDAAEDEKPEHKEIRQLMKALFVKLDALSNFHFTPKPIAPEPKIITNTPAIAMEEVAPVAVSNANLLAPEEVYRGPKNGLMGKTERDRTDKNRERRKKKSKQRAIHKALEEKDLRREKLGIPLTKKEEKAKALKKVTKHRNVEKVTASTDHKALKSSKAFFSQLQDNKTAATKTPKRKADPNTLSAKKLKL